MASYANPRLASDIRLNARLVRYDRAAHSSPVRASRQGCGRSAVPANRARSNAARPDISTARQITEQLPCWFRYSRTVDHVHSSAQPDNPKKADDRLANARCAISLRTMMLEVRDLRKKYGNTVAVDGVNLRIANGETLGLLGPNGAGKTTTVSMIAGRLRPDSGEVLIEGRPLGGDSDPIKHKIGLVPQDLALFDELPAVDSLLRGSLQTGGSEAEKRGCRGARPWPY